MDKTFSDFEVPCIIEYKRKEIIIVVNNDSLYLQVHEKNPISENIMDLQMDAKGLESSKTVSKEGW